MRVRPRFGDYDLVGIGVDNQVRIVGDHNDLAVRFGLDKQRHQLLENGFWIEIFLGLVNDQRPSVPVIQGEVEQQKHDPAGAGRQFPNIDPVIFDAVVNIDVVGAEEPLGKTLRPGAKFRLLSMSDRRMI